MKTIGPVRDGGHRCHVLWRLALVLVIFASSPTAWGQSIADQEEQRRRAQQQAQEREIRQSSPDVRISGEVSSQLEDLSLPSETNCFEARSIELVGASGKPFRWIAPYLKRYEGRCIGQAGINQIIKRVGDQIISLGYVTTRIGIPAQDLSTGMLKFVLVPGVVRAIRMAEGSPKIHWQNAFPMEPGDLLNLRDLEQGLEQLKRVPSQDVDMDIVPGDVPGESDVVLKVRKAKPWRWGISMDDAGLLATGKRQLSTNFFWDNPFGLNDLLSLSLNGDAEQDRDRKGTYGYGWQYSIPFGYWTLGVSESVYEYRQTVAGINQSFISSGVSRSQELKVQRLVFRDQSSKTTLQFRTGTRLSQSFIDDTEILVQHRRTAFAELAIQQRQYIGAVQLDATLSRRNGVPWYGGLSDAIGHQSSNPTYNYAITVLDIGGLASFSLGQQSVRWIGALRAQTSKDVLYSSEQLAIGNRYTVRGFDGEQTLSGERGWYLRNELEFALGASGSSTYIGVDQGQVDGPSTQYLPGKKLAGMAIGLRGSLFGAYYDLFVSAPIQKPDNFAAASHVSGFQLSYQF